jgi:lipopolysaccharide export system permease protein
MFSLIPRYVVRQTVPWIVVSLIGAQLLFLSTQLVRIAPIFAGHGAGFGQTAWAVSLMLCPLMGWALTPAFSIAVFAVGGRMAREGELLALDAAGYSRSRLAAGPVALALLITGLSAWIWLWAAPRSQRNLRGLALDLVEKSLVGQIVPGQFYNNIDGVTFFADAKVSADTFQGVLVETRDPRGHATQVVARRARITSLGNRPGLGITLHQGTAFMEGGAALSFDDFQLRVSLDTALSERLDFLPATLGVPTHRLMGRPPPGTPRQRWRFALWRRIAGPVGTLSLALLSIFLAFTARWRSRGRAVGLAVVIFLVFHLVGRLGEALMASGALLAPAAALLPAAGVSVLLTALLVWPRKAAF